MSYEDNIYYYPEKSGFRILTSVDAADQYEFDAIIVLRQGESGQRYVAHDSGCSCPTPFSGVKVGDLTPVESVADVMEFADIFWPTGDPGYDWRDFTSARINLAERCAMNWGS